MKLTFQCAFAAATLLVSSGAWAQTFGEKGTIAISAERLFGLTYDSGTTTTNGQDRSDHITNISLLSSPVSTSLGNAVWGGYGSPRVAVDYFLIDKLSLGVALGYSHWSLNHQEALGNTETVFSGDSFTFAPRVGYLIPFTNVVGFWPRAGFTYRTFSAPQRSEHDLALTLEAPFTFAPIPHVVFWAGPTLDLGLSGAQTSENKNGSKTSIDFTATGFGLQTALLVYFGT